MNDKMEELNHKNGNKANGNGNGNGNFNGNGNGKVSLEDNVKEITENGKERKRGIKGALRNLLYFIPGVRDILRDDDNQIRELTNIATHTGIDNIIAADPGLEAFYECSLKKLNKIGENSKNYSAKLIVVNEEDSKIKVITAREIDKKKGVSYKKNYPEYIDYQSGVLSAISAFKKIPYEIVVENGEVKLNEIEFVNGQIIRKRPNLHSKLEKTIYNYYSQKENYRKYETPMTDEGLRGIIAIKEEDFVIPEKLDEIKKMQREWDFKILRVENEKSKMAQGLNKALLYEEKKEQATKDPLTGLWNIRHFNTELLSHLDTAMRLWHNYFDSIIMIDADHFKQYNDKYKDHSVGDRALKHITKIIQKSCIYGDDIVVRKGGDEFIVYLPATKGADALKVAERIRMNVKSTPFKINDNEEKSMTVSCGVADTGLGFSYMRKKVKNKEFRKNNQETCMKYDQFLKRHEEYHKSIKDKMLDSYSKKIAREEFFDENNISILGNVLRKISDSASYAAKNDGRDRSYYYTLNGDYSFQNPDKLKSRLIGILKDYANKKSA